MPKMTKRRARGLAYAASKAKVDKKQDKAIAKLNSAVRSELRQSPVYNNINLAAGTTQAGSFYLANGMVQGDADLTREGTRIAIRQLDFTFTVWADASVATTEMASNVRLMVLYDNASSGGIFGSGSLLANLGTAANNFAAPLNMHGKQRYRVLFDKVVTVNPISNSRQAVGATTWDSSPVVIKRSLKFKRPLLTNYVLGNAGTVADILKGSIYAGSFADYDAQANVSVATNIHYTP